MLLSWQRRRLESQEFDSSKTRVRNPMTLDMTKKFFKKGLQNHTGDPWFRLDFSWFDLESQRSEYRVKMKDYVIKQVCSGLPNFPDLKVKSHKIPQSKSYRFTQKVNLTDLLWINPTVANQVAVKRSGRCVWQCRPISALVNKKPTAACKTFSSEVTNGFSCVTGAYQGEPDHLAFKCYKVYFKVMNTNFKKAFIISAK